MKGAASALATITSMRAAATRPHLSRQSRSSDLDAVVASSSRGSASSFAFTALTRSRSGGPRNGPPDPPTLRPTRRSRADRRSPARSRADPDARIDETHDHVHREVYGHDDQGEQDDRALDHRKILVAD